MLKHRIQRQQGTPRHKQKFSLIQSGTQITKKPGFYAFLGAVTKFYRKNPVSDYPCVSPIILPSGFPLL
jgi:hypothetical protein